MENWKIKRTFGLYHETRNFKPYICRYFFKFGFQVCPCYVLHLNFVKNKTFVYLLNVKVCLKWLHY